MILGTRTDGQAILHETFVHELGISLPNLVPVSPHFMEGPIAHCPRGSQHIIMLCYRFTSLDFFKRVESYLEYHEKKPELITVGDLFDIIGLWNLLKQILSTHSPPAFQVPILASGPYRELLVALAHTHEVAWLGAGVNP
jgi:hypothetical protein